MELLLNLAWLFLALPAYSLWRNANANANDSRKRGGPTPHQCLLALGCVLVLLFPVVSATDDLHAMRAEMEESSKRGIRQAVSERFSAGHSQWHNPPAAVVAFSAIIPSSQARRESRAPQPWFAAASRTVHSGRAPPKPPAVAGA
jgi:hypothetical protein